MDSDMKDEDVEALTDLGQTLVDTILDGGDNHTISTLIENGAPLWFQTHEGTSALHAAAFQEDTALVQLLIEKGAVWNAGCPLFEAYEEHRFDSSVPSG